MVNLLLLFFFPLLELDAEWVLGIVEQLLEAIFVDLILGFGEEVVGYLTSLIGESFLGISLALILVGTTGLAVLKATEN